MKKNYFYGLCKAFGFVPILLLTLVLVSFSYASINSKIALESTNFFTAMVAATFLGLSILGLSNLKNPKINFLDFLRSVGFLAGVGAIIVLTINSANLGLIIFYAVVADILLTELVVRFIFGRYIDEEVGSKLYFSSLGNHCYIAVISIVAMLLSALGYLLYDKLGQLISFIGNYGSGIAVAILLAVLLISTCKKNTKASFLDAALSVVFLTSLLAVIYCLSLLDFAAFKGLFYICLSSLAGILLRATSFISTEEKTSKFKVNRYYRDLYAKYDVTISVGIAFLLTFFLILPAMGLDGFNQVLVSIGLSSIQFKIADITNYIIAVIAVVGIIYIFILREIKSKETKAIDIVANMLGYLALFILPYFIILGKDFSGNMKALTNNISLLIATIVMAIVVVSSFILQVLRYIYYKGEEPLEEVVEDSTDAVIEEKAPEEVQEEIVEEEAPEEVQEEVVEEPEEVVEEPTEEVVEEEAPEEVQEEVVEEPTEEVQEEIVYVDEDGNQVDLSEEDAEEDEDGSDEDDIDDEEDEEEASEEEPEEQVDAKEKDILMPEVTLLDENGVPKKIKRRFNTRMMFAPYEAKEYYNEIKNYLLLYRAKGRYSARCETYRYKGLVAKVALAGKSIKVCLAIDPQTLEGSKYHYKDVSEKRQYQEVPTMIKVRSPRGLKYFKELVDIMMATRGVKPKRNYQPTNFMPTLIPNGEAILANLGMSTDYLYPSMNVRGIPAEMPDDLIDYLPVIQGNELEEEEVEANVYLDTLCNHFENGDEITIDVLKSLHIVTKGNVLRIRARGTLDRKLIIYAEYIDADALKMLMCTNCTVVKIVR